MALTSSGSSGAVIGRKRWTISPSDETRNFSKFHWMSPALPSASSLEPMRGVSHVWPSGSACDRKNGGQTRVRHSETPTAAIYSCEQSGGDLRVEAHGVRNPAGLRFFNEYGTHGSQYSPESIMNQYSEFGSQYSATSACNPYASDPPVIVDGNGAYYGRLTVNTSRSDGPPNQELRAWLASACEH